MRQSLSVSPDTIIEGSYGPTYLAHVVGKQVIWPLVKERWGQDWRRGSQPGDEPFSFPKRGRINKKRMDVLLQAECYVGQNDDLTMRTFRTATLRVDEELKGQHRATSLGAAKVAFRHRQEEGAGELSWPDGLDEKLIIQKGVMYGFNDYDDAWTMDLYKTIRGMSGRLDLDVSDAESETVYGDRRMHSYDLDTIALGCVVLGASEHIMEALEAIRSKPLADG